MQEFDMLFSMKVAEANKYSVPKYDMIVIIGMLPITNWLKMKVRVIEIQMPSIETILRICVKSKICKLILVKEKCKQDLNNHFIKAI